ncbi:MAG: hypothetical protein ACI9XO_002811 [Paraglaciecola sp.]|jgi:hypothetical protein
MTTLKHNKTKQNLFLFVLFCLLVPMIQHTFNVVNETPLRGAVAKVEPPTAATWTTWMDGSFQKDYAHYYNHNFGFRGELVRVRNQIEYSLFHQSNAKSVLIGQEDYLYEKGYINAYLGKDFIGDSLINARTKQLKEIRDTLLELGTDVLVVFAAGKGSFFPEYFPEKYQGIEPQRTNYQAYCEAYEALDIPYIDFNKWFVNMRKKTEYPLYAKAGIHWSKYGEYLVMDSLINYLEGYFQKPLSHPILDEIQVSETNLDTDYDIGRGLNLIFPVPTYEMAYPKFHFSKDNSHFRPNVLMVADSYYWGMFNYGLSKKVFDNSEFWFYSNAIYPIRKEIVSQIKYANVQADIEKTDLVILLGSENGYSAFPFKFLPILHKTYYEENQSQ